jgi:hypothetical protein
MVSVPFRKGSEITITIIIIIVARLKKIELDFISEKT